jgi:transformation/transcription domain-associated protein
MAERNIDVFCARLGDPSLDVKLKAQIAQELRDGIDYFTQGAQYPTFLKRLVPIFLKLLEGPPVFISTSAEQVS